MVSTTKIKPAPQLQPFVNCYALRVFDTQGLVMPMPMHAMNECYLTFFLKDKLCSVKDSTTTMHSSSFCTLFTASQGCAYYQGDFILFSVQFASNGIFALFGIPQKILINTILPVDDILGDDARILTEQLTSSENIFEMGRYMDKFLTAILLRRKQKLYTARIATISSTIFHRKGVVSIDQLAYDANMSLRNFERKFIEEVGMSPKLYTRITRFFHALENKMLHPNKNWIVISHESGYFDQAHFIRECKEFSAQTPEELFRFTPPPTEHISHKVTL